VSFFSCRNLTRAPWFDGFDFELAKAEIVVLRGPTGSGKTLLLRSLSELDPADSGEVLLEGVERGSMSAPDWRRHVLYLRQRAAAATETVASEYERVLSLAGTPRRTSDLPEALSLGDSTDHLSGGEMQWLALERGLLVEPQVLLLDEASSALDSESAKRFEQRVLEFVAQGHAALWVAHDEQLSARLGAREIRFP
jgi:putative ABC transport system ATP-binding protein